MNDNLRGAALMVASMACFAVEDALIKALSERFSSAQIIWMLGLGATVIFALATRMRGDRIWTADYLHPRVLLRTSFEVFGTVFFVSSLALVPLVLASAIIQATPLVVAMGAAVFLGSTVGWRRWLAISVGFVGVLIILRPTGVGFEPAILLSVLGMLGLAARDLATRTMPHTISGARLSLHAFAALVPAGMALQAVQGHPLVGLDLRDGGLLILGILIGMGGYMTIVGATRLGDIAFVSSFRYTRMLFALIVGGIAFGERPDLWTLLGVSIVITAGLYTLIREARVRAASQAT